MDIKYTQLSAEEALRLYADWLLEQRIDEPLRFFKCVSKGAYSREWYMIFYPLRTLMLATKLLGDDKYLDAALEFIDIYLTEQLPNGAFTSNYRQQPTESLSKKEFHHILRTGKVNIADVGSNATGIVQAAMMLDGDRKERYLNAVRRWLDEWVPVWALPEGGYGNGIWGGHKINSPYTCAMSTVVSALSAFALATGESEYIENAERCMEFQCSKWLDDGRPIFLNCYPIPSEQALVDFGHSFYLLEGMCWTHSVSKNVKTKSLIERRMREWIFGEKGLLSQWGDSWFNFQSPYIPPLPGELDSTRCGIRHGWEFAKSNGIPHLFIYYLNNVEENAELAEKVELATRYLSHPLKARMSGVASDPEESYGTFAVQATGFAGLSLAEAIQPSAVFNPR